MLYICKYCWIIIVLLLSTTCIANDKYDKYFERWSKRYFSYTVDWRLFKAQGIQESNLNPYAVSSAGAFGVMQLMPGTSSDISKYLNNYSSIKDPETNIMFGIFYDKKMYDIWKNEEGFDRLAFMFGSYNAGVGNILKAQKLANNTNKWDNIVNVLYDITGNNAYETITYVSRIFKIYKQINTDNYSTTFISTKKLKTNIKVVKECKDINIKYVYDNEKYYNNVVYVKKDEVIIKPVYYKVPVLYDNKKVKYVSFLDIILMEM